MNSPAIATPAALPHLISNNNDSSSAKSKPPSWASEPRSFQRFVPSDFQPIFHPKIAAESPTDADVLAFEVDWGRPDSRNAYHLYSVKAELAESVPRGDLGIAVFPEGNYALVERGSKDGVLWDVTTKQPLDPDGKVFARVFEEGRSLSDEQLSLRRPPAQPKREERALRRVDYEAHDDVDPLNDIVSELDASPRFLELAAEFRKADAVVQKSGHPDDGDDELRLLCAQMFRAGELIADATGKFWPPLTKRPQVVCTSIWERITADEEASFAKVAAEENLNEEGLLNVCYALAFSKTWRSMAESLRAYEKADSPKPVPDNWDAEDHGDCDFSLRLFAARIYRAGQLSALKGHLGALDGEPTGIDIAPFGRS